MTRHIAHIALIVKNYDEAINFYVDKLKFKLIEDTVLNADKRWVLVAPEKNNQFSLLLAKADGANQEKFIGSQSGGRVFLFLNTDNFKRDYQNLLDNAIKIIRKPVEEPYGTVAVFEDLYGNQWDLIEPKNIDKN
jgi:catechol 2,3-dioxygenase-like lactoylglutathione lyase family enzyme